MHTMYSNVQGSKDFLYVPYPLSRRVPSRRCGPCQRAHADTGAAREHRHLPSSLELAVALSLYPSMMAD
jgi:hypothetical protein